MVLTNTEVDAAVPATGTPSRPLTNAALKQLILDIVAAVNINALTEDVPPIDSSSAFLVQRDNGDFRRLELSNLADGIDEFQRTISLSGGTTTLAKATHRNALLIIGSGTNTIDAPSSDDGTWVCTVLNDTSTDQTVAGLTVSAGSLTSLIVEGTTVTPFSTTQTKKIALFIQAGDDAVLFNNEVLDSTFTILTARHATASGTITIEIALESGDNTGSFTAVTGMSALSLSSTRATATATGAATASTGAARLRVTGSSNSSATGIELSIRVRA